MSAQLAFFLGICTITWTNSKNTPPKPIDFSVYQQQWKKAKMNFKFLSRAEEIKGEYGMFEQNAKETFGDDFFKREYILIPVGSTTSQPLISQCRKLQPVEIALADKFGAKPPFPTDQTVQKFVANIKKIRNERFSYLPDPTKVPVIFVKSLSWELKPKKLPKGADMAKFCKQYSRSAVPIYKGRKKKDIEKVPQGTYKTLLKHITEADHFYLSLDGPCAGKNLKKEPSIEQKKVPKLTFAWADYFAQHPDAIGQNQRNKVVAVGDIGGGGNPDLIAYKDTTKHTNPKKPKINYKNLLKVGTAQDTDPCAKKNEQDKCESGEWTANNIYKTAKKQCEGKETSDECKDASKKLADSFIENIKNRRKGIKGLTIDVMAVRQTGRIRAEYYDWLKTAKTSKEKLKAVIEHKKVMVQQRIANMKCTRYMKLQKQKKQQAGPKNSQAHVGLDDYYNEYDDEYNQYDYDYSDEYDDEYEEYDEYDNNNDEYYEDIDTLYYEAANNLLRAKDNFDVAQQIKQGNEAKKQRNGYYYYH